MALQGASHGRGHVILRLGLGAGVVVFTIASATMNYEHMRTYGYAAAGIVIAAELLKPLLPIALVQHATARHTGAWVGTLCLWLMIVFFSFVNSFGNTLLRHAKVKETQAMVAREVTRPEHVILRDLAALPQCPPLKKVREEAVPASKGVKASTKRTPYEEPDTECQQQRAAAQLAFTAEITESKRRESRNLDVAVSQHTVTDGYVQVANMFGWSLRRHEADILTVLLWTLLCEIGSAFGGLAIPRNHKP